ncbi:hypothetical protein [Nostoc sp.]
MWVRKFITKRSLQLAIQLQYNSRRGTAMLIGVNLMEIAYLFASMPARK